MKFIIQKDSTLLDTEHFILRNMLRNGILNIQHTEKDMYLKEVSSSYIEPDCIPVGTIEFVSGVLRKISGFTFQNPIEIPDYLRTDEFLKREYRFILFDDIPSYGTWFLKDVSRLKNYAYFGDMAHIDKPEDNSSIYLLSENYCPVSEFRVYVFNKKITDICCYNGNVTYQPDIKLIQKAVTIINYNEKFLKSYTLDVMVGEKGTALLEIHNFTSCGIYTSVPGNYLPNAYADGIEYLLYDNTCRIPDFTKRKNVI